ncbi:MAG: AMP-dependent synthetase/ligase [Saccharofermentanales bacterium]
MKEFEKGPIPVPYIENLRDLWTGSVRSFAQRPVFLTKPVKGQPYVPVSYSQFGNDITYFGTALMRHEMRRDKRVAILSETRYEWYVSYLAVLSGESIVVPLDKELTVPELATMLKQADVSCIIYSSRYAEKAFSAATDLPAMALLVCMDGMDVTVPLPGVSSVSFQEMIAEGRKFSDAGDDSLLTHPIDTDEMRILLFTSGTTAVAKAVMHSHGTIAANLMQMNSFFLVEPEDVFLSILPLHHTYECTCGFLCPLHRGAAIAMNEGLRYLTDNLRESRTTIFCVVPLMLDVVYKRIWKEIGKNPRQLRLVQIMRRISDGLRKVGIDIRPKAFARIREGFGPYLRLIVTGGAAVDTTVEKCMNAFGYLILQGYGLTECAPLLAFNAPDKHKEGTAGYPVPGVDIKIIDPDENGIGEICGSGPNIMLGYWNQPDETAAALEGGYFHTGDLGYVDQDGFVIIRGRKKNVIITKNGKNVFPEELEFMLARNPLVAKVLVSGELQPDGDTLVVAEIFPNMDASKEKNGGEIPDAAALRLMIAEVVKEANSHAAAFKMIHRFTLRDTEFPKTTSLKIRRANISQTTQTTQTL